MWMGKSKEVKEKTVKSNRNIKLMVNLMGVLRSYCDMLMKSSVISWETYQDKLFFSMSGHTLWIPKLSCNGEIGNTSYSLSTTKMWIINWHYFLHNRIYFVVCLKNYAALSMIKLFWKRNVWMIGSQMICNGGQDGPALLRCRGSKKVTKYQNRRFLDIQISVPKLCYGLIVQKVKLLFYLFIYIYLFVRFTNIRRDEWTLRIRGRMGVLMFSFIKCVTVT